MRRLVLALVLTLGASLMATSTTAVPASRSPSDSSIVNLEDAERGTIVGVSNVDIRPPSLR
jgi:hypothetical protein